MGFWGAFMQFSYKVGGFSSGYSSINVNSSGFVILDSVGTGSATVTIQLNGTTWEIINAGVNGGTATTLLSTSNAALSTATDGVGLAWTGESGTANFIGGDLIDFLLGGDGDDTLQGGLGADSLYGGPGNDSILGGDGNDSIRGEAGNDTIYGNDGNDSVLGAAGNDSIVGGAGNDSIDGGADNDILFGDAGNDTLIGGAGNDTIYGGDGDDSITGGTENDSLVGGDGADTLSGGAGADTLDGGNGSDIFLDVNGDTITTFATDDVIRITGGAAQSLTNSHLRYDSATKTLTVDYDKNGTFGGGTDIVVTFTNAPSSSVFQVSNNGGFAEIKLGPETTTPVATSAPTLDLNGVNAGTDTAVVFNVTTDLGGDKGVALMPSLILSDNGRVETVSVLVNNPLGSDRLFLTPAAKTVAAAAGLIVTFANNDSLLTVVRTGTATTDDIQTLLQGLRFQNNGDAQALGGRGITVVATDNDSTSVIATVSLAFNGKSTPVTPSEPSGPGPVVTIPVEGEQTASLPTLPVIVGSTIQPPPSVLVPVTSTALEDGVEVGRGVGADPLTGLRTEVTVVSPVTAGRINDANSPTANADIRLAGTVGQPALVATLPLGVGIQASGFSFLTLGQLTGAVGIETGRIHAAGTVDLTGLSSVLPSDTPVNLRTITPTVSSGVTTAPTQPIVISVPTSTNTAGTVSAVVIDGRSVPAGSVIELRGVDYAFATGNVFVTGGTGRSVVIGDDARQYLWQGAGDNTLRGGGGDDTVGSGTGSDLLYGDAGNDSVFGGDGADRLAGGTGNDTIDGGAGIDVARIQASFSNVTIVRQANGDYIVTDTRADGQGIDRLVNVEVLRLDDRVVLLRQPEVLKNGENPTGFYEQEYLQDNPDVAAAVASGVFKSGQQHWDLYGRAEGRAGSQSFDEAYYLAHNPDVARAVAQGVYKSGFDHYAKAGQAEHRQADATHAYNGQLFSESYYRAENPDVARAIAAGQYASGYDHWVKTGQAEGRTTFAALKGDVGLFDEAFYLAQNPDVAAAVAQGTYSSGLDHFARVGQTQGREANALFDSAWYLAHNPDVAAAVATGLIQGALEHYSKYGWKEGRDPSAWFDTSDYLAAHADVATLGINPLAHLLAAGQFNKYAVKPVDDGLWL